LSIGMGIRVEVGMKLSGKWKWELSPIVGMGIKWHGNEKEVMGMRGNENQNTVPARHTSS